MLRTICYLVLLMIFALAGFSFGEEPAEVVLRQVKFEGFESVEPDVLKELEETLVGQRFPAAEASRNITYCVRNFLVQHGYVRSVVAPLEVVSLQEGAIAATIPVDEGPRFSFGMVQVLLTSAEE